jgi:MFS family permease
MAAMTVVAGPLSGRLVGSRGARPSLVTAGIALFAAGLMLSLLDGTTVLAWLIVSFVVFGFGFAVVNAPITNTAVSGMPREQAGVAAATTSMSRQFGVSLGVAVTGAMVSSAGTGGFVAAARPGWWFIAGCGAVVLILGLLTTTSRARGTAAATAARLMPEPEKVAP